MNTDTDHSMFVCLCQQVTEAELHAAVDAGAVTLRQLGQTLHVATCCGGCSNRVKACLRDALKVQAENKPVFASAAPMQVQGAAA